MGLDMYLEKEIYVGANYEHNNVNGVIDIKQDAIPIKIDLSKVNSITERVGYWRKANQIHKWFVNNVQDGEDDCKKYGVPFEKLLELKSLCEKVLQEKNPEHLPPEKGFFFGSTEADEYYFGKIKETIEIIEALDPEGEYYYRASW